MPPVQASVPEPGVAEVLGDATPGVAEELGRGEARVVGSAEGVAPVGVGVAVVLAAAGVDGAAKRWLASEVTQWVMQHRAILPRGRGG